MDNSQQVVNIQNQIDQEQTRHRNRMQALRKSLENAKRGTEEWNQIRNKLVTGYSKYLPSIDQEIDKTGTLANSYDRLAESIQKAAAIVDEKMRSLLKQNQ